MVESGSHAELLARGGRYSELWARQQSRVDDVYDSSGSGGLPSDRQEAAAGAAGAGLPPARGAG